MLLRAGDIIRRRKLEFDAWLVFEAGKTWPEADADVSEAIDFCEYYAREMQRLSGPQSPPVQLPGEHDELLYLPLGVGVVIPPWNFPLAIMVGMTVAALVAGNTVIIKPSSETPTIAAKFAEVLLEAGFPAQSFCLLTGSGAAVGDVLVEHPKTRFVAFTGSRDVGLRINELAAKTQPGQIWIKRVIAEMGGKDAIVVDAECDLDKAVEGVAVSAFGYSGSEVLGLLARDCGRQGLRRVPGEAAGARFQDQGGSGGGSRQLHGAGDQRGRAAHHSGIHRDRQEGRPAAAGRRWRRPGDGYFVQPTVIADVDSKARIFQEEIFGPVLAVTKARDFDHAMELANDSQYGLTGAVFSNVPEHIERARQQFFVGNLYVNRKCTGAMVGAHPFGGFNMSGTDSKAGGPDYLLLFLQAKSIAERVA